MSPACQEVRASKNCRYKVTNIKEPYRKLATNKVPHNRKVPNFTKFLTLKFPYVEGV